MIYICREDGGSGQVDTSPKNINIDNKHINTTQSGTSEILVSQTYTSLSIDERYSIILYKDNQC